MLLPTLPYQGIVLLLCCLLTCFTGIIPENITIILLYLKFVCQVVYINKIETNHPCKSLGVSKSQTLEMQTSDLESTDQCRVSYDLCDRNNCVNRNPSYFTKDKEINEEKNNYLQYSLAIKQVSFFPSAVHVAIIITLILPEIKSITCFGVH